MKKTHIVVLINPLIDTKSFSCLCLVKKLSKSIRLLTVLVPINVLCSFFLTLGTICGAMYGMHTVSHFRETKSSFVVTLYYGFVIILFTCK